MSYRSGMFSFVLVAALPVAAFAQSSAVSRQSEERAVRAADADFLRAVGAHEVNKIAAMYAPDAVVMNPNAPAVTGAGIRKSWSELLALPGGSLTWAPTRVEVAASGDLASETGSYQLSYNGPNGKVNDAGNFVTVWRKHAGQWKVMTDAVISSTPMPMVAAGGGASDVAAVASMETRVGTALTWTDLVVPGFAPGTKMAVLHGDPSKAEAYVLRLQFPDGYEFPLHWHPGAEQLTVLSGSFHLGMGAAGGESAVRTYAPGDFLFIPARMAHSGGAKGVTVIQLHGMGPFAINLGTPSSEGSGGAQ